MLDFFERHPFLCITLFAVVALAVMVLWFPTPPGI